MYPPAPTSYWKPFGHLGFVFCGHQAVKACDPCTQMNPHLHLIILLRLLVPARARRLRLREGEARSGFCDRHRDRQTESAVSGG